MKRWARRVGLGHDFQCTARTIWTKKRADFLLRLRGRGFGGGSSRSVHEVMILMIMMGLFMAVMCFLGYQ